MAPEKALIDRIAEVATAVGWQAGVGTTELAGQIVSCLYALTLQRHSGLTPHLLRQAAEAQRDRLVEALLEISSPTQTENLLWWQIRARSALASIESKP